ncbi:MAG: hypothetical protein WA478_23845, partial [Pseudolabrys sp.]
RSFMAIHEPVPIDLKTVTILREVLEDAWYSLGAEQQAMMSKTVLAERILRSAAKGERDRKRLLAAALNIAA